MQNVQVNNYGSGITMEMIDKLKYQLDETRQQRVTDHDLYQDRLAQNPDMDAATRKATEEAYMHNQNVYDEKIRDLEARLDAAIEALRAQQLQSEQQRIMTETQHLSDKQRVAARAAALEKYRSEKKVAEQRKQERERRRAFQAKMENKNAQIED